MKEYDSTYDTNLHISRVRKLLHDCQIELVYRALQHDASKLEEPEKSAFDIATPKLKSLTFGSDEYKQSLADLGPALDHHYKNNSHHPQYYENGIDGMDLFDVLEMLVDWKAASERHSDGDFNKSIEINVKRFNISPQLESILRNTAVKLFDNELPF